MTGEQKLKILDSSSCAQLWILVLQLDTLCSCCIACCSVCSQVDRCVFVCAHRFVCLCLSVCLSV